MNKPGCNSKGEYGKPEAPYTLKPGYIWSGPGPRYEKLPLWKRIWYCIRYPKLFFYTKHICDALLIKESEMSEYSLFIGRYQTRQGMHEGHKTIVRAVLDEDPNKNALIAIRDMPKSEKDPFPAEYLKGVIQQDWDNSLYAGRVEVIVVPNITEVCYGRTPAWKIREVKVSEDIEKISATSIRAKEQE